VKLYAVKDRMIDYFMVPFPAPDDNQALAGVAEAVNGERQSAISQAPHHFEVYLLGEIDEHGTIFPKKELICDCSSLVRTRRESTEPVIGKASIALQETAARIERTGGNSSTHS